MPVDSTHPDYDAAHAKWRRCRDAYAGVDAIKATIFAAAGINGAPEIVPDHRMYRPLRSYLPKLDGQDNAQYEAYVERALWYGATKRTVQGLTGAVFRKDANIDAPEKIEAQLDDITLDSDVTLQELAKALLEEVLVVGRVGVLVEMPAETDAVSGAERRPYWVTYEAEHITNWSTRRVNGHMMLSLIVLQENVPVADEDEFANATAPQYRVLKLDAENAYAVEIWKQVEKQGTNGQKTVEFQLAESYTPTNQGKRLQFIPFCFFGPNGLSPDIKTPPLLDLVDVNLSHYRSSADFEHGLHYTALPTPYALGFPPETKLTIGPGTCWMSPNPEGKVGMLEFNGQGLQPLADAILSKEQKMAALGARLLETQGRNGVEAAETVRLRQSGEQGALHSIAETLSQGLTKALQWHAAWAGAPPEATVQVNKDFYDVDMPPLMLQTLMAALQAETISYETFYYNLQKGEIARPGVSAEEEQQLIGAHAGTVGAEPSPEADPVDTGVEDDS